MSTPLRVSLFRSLRVVAVFCALITASLSASAQLTVELQDFAILPITGSVSGSSNAASLARVNFMRTEPGNSDRQFVNDLNGPLYMLDKTTKQFTTYLQFNGDPIGSNPAGMFGKMTYDGGYANGLVSFQFDPDYESNGVFYTIHLEDTGFGSQIPDNSNVPGLDTSDYTSTSPISSVGSTSNPREAVLIEWTDTNTSNSVFEGSARELLRIEHNTRIHPMGDMVFNPNAQPGDEDWRVMYLAVGDGGAGERSGSARLTPQRLDLPTGKILRIIPDLGEHTDTSTVSGNGRYRIPDGNPFTSTTGVLGEIYALGFRNPHRISWDAESDSILVNDIGLHTWEEVNIVHEGANYGYSQREGNQQLLPNNSTAGLPIPDEIPIQINGLTTNGMVTPIYPVIQYGHADSSDPLKGDAISSGFVYRGSRVPLLKGKYVFGDITTGQLFYADFEEMLLADDGDPSTLASFGSLDVLWDNPNDAQAGAELYTTITPSNALLGPMHQIIQTAYHDRGGLDPNLPGGANVTGSFGRADVRLAMDDDGELYVLSKMDGMIRAIVGPKANADFDGDGFIDGTDFLIWQRGYGSPGSLASGDANSDGIVNTSDLEIWQLQYGETGGDITASQAIPEPATAALLLVFVYFSIVARQKSDYALLV